MVEFNKTMKIFNLRFFMHIKYDFLLNLFFNIIVGDKIRKTLRILN